MEEVKKETEVLATKIGHKRLVVVYGEHPETDADYIVDSMKTIYGVKEKVKDGCGEIRRVNVNAAPMCVADMKKLHEGMIQLAVIVCMGVCLAGLRALSY